MQDNISKICKAIADPTRRDIFHVLVVAAVSMPIVQISAQFNMSRQGITKHIKTLESAGLVTIQTQGRERYCFANPKSLQEVQKWLHSYDKFWDTSLDHLSSFLEQKN